MTRLFPLQTQIDLAKFVVESERAKQIWSHIILKIGRAAKAGDFAKKQYEVTAVNAATNAQVRLLVDAEIVLTQSSEKIVDLLLDKGVVVDKARAKVYFLICSAAKDSEKSDSPAEPRPESE